jgi:hypothetical protein
MLVFRRHSVINVLRVLWLFVIVFYEYGIFLTSAIKCDWPDDNILSLHHLDDQLGLSHHNGEGDAISRPYHVLLVADPQVVDRHSYPSRSTWLSYLTRTVVDLNLRKNWQAALHKKPDLVVFLGDAMDNGRLDMSDEEWVIVVLVFVVLLKQK